MDVSDMEHTGTETTRGNGTALKEKARLARQSAMDLTKATYEQIQEKAKAAYGQLSEKATDCSQATDRAIRQNPYTALGCALGIGLLLGALLTRRTNVVKVIKEKD
jgi:ElaB/YqjD/DUF883 family membrane-anchored ribosome-binding protein